MIYFIENNEKHVKIGFTLDMKQRLTTLQTGNSSGLKLLYVIEGNDSSFETHIHNICQDFNIQGEWFSEKVIPFLLAHPWYKKNMKNFNQSF